MQYIVHRRLKDAAICGGVNIPATTICEEICGVIYYNGLPVCYTTSENAHQFFARNDDECGLRRGKLTQTIQKHFLSVMVIIRSDGIRSGQIQNAVNTKDQNMKIIGFGIMSFSTLILMFYFILQI